MLAIDEYFLVIGESPVSCKSIVIKDRLEFLLVRLKLSEAFLRQNRFLFTRNRIEIGITKEEFRESFQKLVFQFCWREG